MWLTVRTSDAIEDLWMIDAYLRLTLITCCISLFLTSATISTAVGIAGRWSLTVGLAIGIFSAIPILICVLVRRLLGRYRAWLVEASNDQAHHVDSVDLRRVTLLLTMASALSLFGELSLIRWHSSIFPLFALYKNFSLLACFAGLGFGYAISDRRHLPLIMTPLLLVWQIVVLLTTRATVSVFAPGMLQTTPVNEQLDMGLQKFTGVWANVPSYVLLAVVFLLSSLTFIPIGQLCGRLMERRDKLEAYGANLIGSVLGVVLMFVASWLWTPPAVWFGFLLACLLVFYIYRPAVLLTGSLATVAVLVALNWPTDVLVNQIHSPYQLLECTTKTDGRLQVLAAGHYFQRVYDLSTANANVDADAELRRIANYYEFPYVVADQIGHVAVVGSGTGNDVAAALRRGATHVDAVEIDPALVELGRRFHPERPYDNERVSLIVNDARTHFRNTEQRYDMIVYGLLDSHALLSHASNVRLDSFVYTVEGFREAFERLNDGGVLSVSFCTGTTSIGRKIYVMMTEASGGRHPVCCKASYDESVIFLLRKGAPTALRAELFDRHDVVDVTQVYADERLATEPSTDDWPFFYMPKRVYPFSYLPMALLVLAATALLTTVTLRHPSRIRLKNLDFFFLGVGFMLVETKAITELGLTFGNTWHVIGIAIAGILTMAFLANVIVLRCSIQRLTPTYIAILLCLILGFLVARNGTLPSTAIGRIVATVLLTSPMFFAGIVFSTLLRDGDGISGVMCANLLGCMVGGLLEYNSMYFGFANLYLFAIVLYAIAFACSCLRKASTVARDCRCP
jgi:spermidine synthase